MPPIASAIVNNDHLVVIDSEVKDDDEEINSKWPCHQTNQIARAKPQKPPETSKITLSRNVVK